MSEDPPPLELWVLVAEAALVLVGAWAYAGGMVRWGEFLASWALTAAVLAFVAGAFVPWTRGMVGGARAFVLTLLLGASGGVLTAATMAGILVLSVIRTGLWTSEGDVVKALVTGGPSGAWLGAAAGLASGLVLAVAVLVVDGIRGVPENPDRPKNSMLVIIGAASGVALMAVAEVQHWAPASLVAGCSAGCQAWTMPLWVRMVSAALAAIGTAGGIALLLERPGLHWRAPLGVVILGIGAVSLGLGNTVFTTTTGPRFRRATLGLPPMPLPLTRELVDATVTEHPGYLLDTVEVRWPDGDSETIVIGVGPFRPDTGGLATAMRSTAQRWQADAMPGRLDE